MLTGFYGILAMPEPEIAHVAAGIAQESAGHAEYRVTAENAHVTLYQARFSNLPEHRVHTLLKRLAMAFPCGDKIDGIVLHLDTIEIYEANPQYLFWNTRLDGRLAIAHEASLSIAPYIEARETAERTRTREEENARDYGHTLVGEAFLPHLTLAAHSKPFAPSSIRPMRYSLPAVVTSFALGRLGKWGRLEEIVFSVE